MSLLLLVVITSLSHFLSSIYISDIIQYLISDIIPCSLAYLSLSIMPSKSMLLQILQCNSFLLIFHCVYLPNLFIHKSVDGYLDCFHILAILHLFFTDEETKTVRSQVPKYALLIHFRAGLKPNLRRL